MVAGKFEVLFFRSSQWVLRRGYHYGCIQQTNAPIPGSKPYTFSSKAVQSDSHPRNSGLVLSGGDTFPQ